MTHAASPNRSLRRRHAASVDALYDDFCSELSPDLRDEARSLAVRLHLAPRPVPWGNVFNHEVTLGAPALVAAALRIEDWKHVSTAVRAHMLAVIEAFGTDRILDGQVEADDGLQDLLREMRRARDVAIRQLIGPSDDVMFDTASADEATLAAIHSERECLRNDGPVDFDRYIEVSLGKQSVGFPASLALVEASGGSEHQLDLALSALSGVWLGLQYFDDVNDWEDDLACGGAWAVGLARSRVHVPGSSPRDIRFIRRAVLSSGVLHDLLEMSSRQFLRAQESATLLGAQRLAAWARAQQLRVAAAADAERRCPGYTVRARQLSAWAVEAFA